MNQPLEMHTAFERAIEVMEESYDHLFITGKAGTGKSTLLEYFCDNTDKHPVVLAPTGVAAMNVKGQTIHSFFNFYMDITPQKVANGEVKVSQKSRDLYECLQTIVIDEVSMVRADLLDCIDQMLRRYGPQPTQPFGGVQMIFVGDLYQLPPVVKHNERQLFSKHYQTPYFFSAQVMESLPLEHIELEKVYRQKNGEFITLLNRIRNNTVQDTDIERLNSRYCSDDDVPLSSEYRIHLTTTNRKADEINAKHLSELKDKTMKSRARITGLIGKEYYPTAEELSYKVGAQIMLLNNDQQRRWVNGSIAKIKAIKKDKHGTQYLKIQLEDNQEKFLLYPYTWEMYQFKLKKNAIISEPIGTFTQYPMRLAWAITIHKSQGKTFEHVIFDVDRGTFASGQIYVALSRCTTFEGIILKAPIKKEHIRTDYLIVKFLTDYHYKKSEAAQPLTEKIALLELAIENNQPLRMAYLQGDNRKSVRKIQPISIGEKTYRGNAFHGLSAYCYELQSERIFSVKKILLLTPIDGDDEAVK